MAFGKIQKGFNKVHNMWWFIILAAIAYTATDKFIGHRILPPKTPKPYIKITKNFVKTIPRTLDISGQLRVDYTSDKNITGIQLFIHNKSEEKDKNFEFKIYTRDAEIEINPITIIYIPTLLKYHVIGTDSFNEGKNGFYRKINIFPPGSMIYLEIFPKLKIQEEDLKFEFLSDSGTWFATEGDIKYKPNKSLFGQVKLFRTAFALDDTPKDEKLPPKGRSGILIGGYDPLILTNNFFKILQEENLISKIDAKEIKGIVEDTKGGVLFGGVNILKFNEAAINALIRNKKLTEDDALEILDKSKKSGGVLIGGYNIIVLEVQVMNSLIKNGYLNLDKAQNALDSAKHSKKKE